MDVLDDKDARKNIMLEFDAEHSELVGPAGRLPIRPDDQVARKLMMLIEGQCFGMGGAAAARKYGFCKQRYAQLLKGFRQSGTSALQGRKPGPKGPRLRTDEAVRQVIRHRYLDPDVTVEVIAQKLRQTGCPISARSVRRVIDSYGLQKKTLRAAAGRRTGR